jgi:hypothetical protein
VKECQLIQHSFLDCELRIILFEQNATRFTDLKAARISADLLEGALRADGWTDTA